MKYIHFFFCLLLGMAVQAQIKIGDNPQTIDPSSVLELESSSRVLVITRVNTAQMNVITPSAGALVYNTDIECIHYYTGTEWKDICDAVAGSISFTSDDGTVVITSTGDNNYNIMVGQIKGDNIIDTSILGTKLWPGSITSDKLAPDSVGADQLRTGSVTNDNLQQDIITSLEIINSTIKPEDMEAGGPDQLLTTDAAGNVAWLDKTELGSVQADQLTITGAGTTTDQLKVADTVIGDILANANAITVNANNIAQNSNDITANTNNIAQNSTDIATNTNDIGANTNNIAQNSTDIAANTNDIAANTINIAQNSTDIAANTTLINSHIAADLDINDTNEIELPDDSGATTGDVLSTDATGNYSWITPAASSIPSGTTGSIFFASDDGSGTGPLIENNTNLFWENSNARMGIGTNTPTSNLHTSGSFSTNIRPIDTPIATILDNDHTVILGANVTEVSLPTPDANNLGRIYIIKNTTGNVLQITAPTIYIDSEGDSTNTIAAISVIQLQSDGNAWQQIN